MTTSDFKNRYAPISPVRLRLYTTGMILGGLAPLVTGIVAIWGYTTKGYFIAKTGEVTSGTAGLLMAILFILAGLGMIAFAFWSYRQKKYHQSAS